jgi:Nucleoside-diphosphate-sugar epimerases
MTPLILVTGGAGFIGGHLVDALLRMDRPVRVLDDFSFGDRARVDEWSGRVEVVEGDILNPELVERAGHGAMTIVHLAAISSVEMSIDDPGRVHDVNTKGTLHVAQAAASNGAKLISARARPSTAISRGSRQERTRSVGRYRRTVLKSCSPSTICEYSNGFTASTRSPSDSSMCTAPDSVREIRTPESYARSSTRPCAASRSSYTATDARRATSFS